MKKGILLLSTMLGLASLSQAQKLALYEEFSGENCGPCASANPALMTLLGANTTKALLIKYQSPIPSGGPIYNQNTADVGARTSYYSVPFAPYARMNGAVVGTGTNAGHVALTTQAMIDAAALEATPFTMTIGTPTITGSNFSAVVTITANAATPVTSLKLRFSLVEDLVFSTPPGTNGETSFHHVMRKMYPTADGTTLTTAFAAGVPQTFTISGAVPAYVSAENPRMFIAWIQNDATKVVMQATKSANLPAAANAVSSEGITIASNLKCSTPGSFVPTVTIKNTGTATLTSATVYYKSSTASTFSTYNFTGSVAPGATTNVTLPAVSVASSGVGSIMDSLAMPNGQVDPNPGNNVSSVGAVVLNSTAAALPLSYDVEAVVPDWVSYATATGEPIRRVWYGNTSAYLGHNNSTWALYFRSPFVPSGTQGFYILPKANLATGAKALDFYLSYAMRDAAGDKLEVVYTTDCGATWTSVWSQENANLATTTATTGTTLHLPNASSYKMRSVDVTNVPNGAYIAFRATSGGANYIFIDDIKLRQGAVGINDVINASTLKVYPNPVENTLNVSLTMKKSQTVTFSIVNALGQEVLVSQKDLTGGEQTIDLNASQLAAGMYILNIKTAEGNTQQKFLKK